MSRLVKARRCLGGSSDADLYKEAQTPKGGTGTEFSHTLEFLQLILDIYPEDLCSEAHSDPTQDRDVTNIPLNELVRWCLPGDWHEFEIP